jgi:hypothetical protein
MCPSDHRDWYRGKHPPSCTCVDCTNERLRKLRKEAHPDYVSVCPRCGKKSLFFNGRDGIYECLNLSCKAKGRTLGEVEGNEGRRGIGEHSTSAGGGRGGHRPHKIAGGMMPNWFRALLLVFALSIVGLSLSVFLRVYIPFWILLGFSVVFSIEKWFAYLSRRHKGIGKLYRLLLNLSILSLLWLSVWSGIRLFSHQFPGDPLAGSLVFLAELVAFVWIWRVVSNNSWRWPSMRLTLFSLTVLFIVLAFAGVEPMSTYKDRSLTYVASLIETSSSSIMQVQQPTPTTRSPTVSPPSAIPTPTPRTTVPVISTGIDKKTGVYKNYYLGLVKDPDGVIGGNDCYGEFIILINNRDARNPTYSGLLEFLQRDKTDEYPYRYSIPVGGSYYGTAEDKVDLGRLKNIIDGSIQPEPPMICADFAERLHNNAEKAGLRCAYVSLDMIGYTDPYGLGMASDGGHALVVFETTDRGLVYVDDTGTSVSGGPSNCDKVVSVQVGKPYVPQSLFPDPGWESTWDSMGTVTGVFVAWDGSWNK